MSHWTDSLVGFTCRGLGHYKLTMVPGKELKEGDEIYSPSGQAINQNCPHCNATNDRIVGVQVHRIVRTKTGRRQGMLLWKHDGYITLKPPSLDFEKINRHGIDWIIDNKKPFCLAWWSSRDSLTTIDKVIQDMKTVSKENLIRLPRFWHPSQWEKAPTRENTAITALENM